MCFLGGSITHWKTVRDVSDANDIFANGVYNVTSGQNVPFDYCVMLVLNYAGKECVQIAFDILTSNSKKRIFVNNSWYEWKSW